MSEENQSTKMLKKQRFGRLKSYYLVFKHLLFKPILYSPKLMHN